jgi:hypothetical protein
VNSDETFQEHIKISHEIRFQKKSSCENNEITFLRFLFRSCIRKAPDCPILYRRFETERVFLFVSKLLKQKCPTNCSIIDLVFALGSQ